MQVELRDNSRKLRKLIEFAYWCGANRVLLIPPTESLAEALRCPRSTKTPSWLGHLRKALKPYSQGERTVWTGLVRPLKCEGWLLNPEVAGIIAKVFLRSGEHSWDFYRNSRLICSVFPKSGRAALDLVKPQRQRLVELGFDVKLRRDDTGHRIPDDRNPRAPVLLRPRIKRGYEAGAVKRGDMVWAKAPDGSVELTFPAIDLGTGREISIKTKSWLVDESKHLSLFRWWGRRHDQLVESWVTKNQWNWQARR